MWIPVQDLASQLAQNCRIVTSGQNRRSVRNVKLLGRKVWSFGLLCNLQWDWLICMKQTLCLQMPKTTSSQLSRDTNPSFEKERGGESSHPGWQTASRLKFPPDIKESGRVALQSPKDGFSSYGDGRRFKGKRCAFLYFHWVGFCPLISWFVFFCEQGKEASVSIAFSR